MTVGAAIPKLPQKWLPVNALLITFCPVCQGGLNPVGECLGCLLRVALTDEAESTTPWDAPHTFGDFEIARRADGSRWELGRGGMGVTYRATDQVLSRDVALKVVEIPAGVTDSPALHTRFLREARSTARLRHPNVAEVFQFGTSPETGQAYYAMQLINGETLEERVRREGPLPLETALEVTVQVAHALVAAAGQGLVHRDLKPANIMLSHAGLLAALHVTVIDFGLARALAGTENAARLTAGGFVGTPAFASPEQFRAEPVDARSDIYSLGVTLWYALTGCAPFAGHTMEELRDHPGRVNLPVAQLQARKVPARVVSLLCGSLATDPARRPASARALLTALEACRRHPRGRRSGLAVVSVVGVLSVAGVLWSLRPGRVAAPAGWDRSIAVLPFDNFSEDKDSAYFADGVQDEVLADLAKVADLKVISRTSVMPYKDTKQRNLREIGKALDVAYVVEGSVRRAGNRVRVTAQLIDARTDAHKWADQYDGDLSNIFTIQSRMARQIADALHSQLSPAEKAVIAERPTDDLEAYRLYTEANAIVIWDDMQKVVKSIARKVDLLEEAVQRDPSFTLAYCALAKTQCDYQEMGGGDVHLALAKKAAETARQLRPDLGEPHRALAFCYTHDNDLDHARAEITVALRTLPNDADTYRLAANIDAVQNRWNDSLAKLQKAYALDPNNVEVTYYLGVTYRVMRRYREYEQMLIKMVPSSEPEHYWNQLALAEIKLATSNAAAAKALLDGIPVGFNPTDEFRFVRYQTALYLHDYEAVTRIMAGTPAGVADGMYTGIPPESRVDGMLARLRGDEPKAQAIFAAVRRKLDANLGDGERDADYFGTAGVLDAWLGRKEQAIREGRQAVELMPITRDATRYPEFLSNLALVYAMTGEPDQAVEQLERAATLPTGPTYGELRLHPCWDCLRGNPRFEAIVTSLAPK